MASEKFPKDGPMLPWTGERYVPELEGQIALEHLHRYAMARELAKDKHVLDIACGEGYGSAMLAEVAHRVIGVDISKDVVDHARRKYKRDNLRFKVGSCSKIPIKNASVDLVVSFETIEHHDQHEAMMSEIKRVLRPNGVLIISSPEKHEYSEIPGYKNPFHVKELYRHEFEKLIASHFKHIAMYGQRVIYGSGILQEKKISNLASFSQKNRRIKATQGIARPIYLIAVASDGTVPKVASGVFEQPVNESEIVRSLEGVVRERDGQIVGVSHAVVERDAQIASLNQIVAERDGQIANLGQVVAERDGQITAVTQEHERTAAWAQQLDTELNTTKDRLGALTQEHERTAAWAKSLDRELAELRAKYASLASEHETRSQWAKQLDTELNTTRERLGALTQEHERATAWAKTLDAELATTRQRLAEFNSEITNLNRTVTHRDAQIAILNQAVAERDGQIASLEQTIVEREAQVASLNHAASELGGQVIALKEAVAERASQVASLDQVAAERDGQIANLNQAVAERDKQHAAQHDEAQRLQQVVSARDATVAERDGQIAELTNETVRRGEWALGLDQQLKVAQAKIAQITSSNSWRITLPLREGRRWLTNPSSQAKRYLRGAAKLGKAVYMRLPLSHQTKTAHRLFLAKHAPGVLRASKGQSISVPVLHVPKVVAQTMADLDSAASGINLTTSLQPVVSVIIPIYGKCDYTLRCLASIAANSPSTPFEVIVVDDCSPDNSAEVLQGVDGIRLISNPENQGFVRSCNIGAKAASGQYLHFLNNDTEVTPGSLDELVRTFHEFPGTGLVGSKLVYPDGTLQEAGGIIWQDGSAWNFGRNQDPSLPVYNYAREVDYCSGASIMVPKALFEELDGFDEHYLPAYCEDSDLALKIRDRGHRVIYQPLSVVVHYEGVTSGTDTTQGTKAYQLENSKKLFERWKGRLQHHQAPGTDVDGAKDRVAKRRVLVLDHCTPTPNQDSGSIDAFNLMMLLREMDFQVTFIPEDNFLYMPDYTPALQRAGIEVLYAPYYTSVEQHLKESGRRYDLAFLFRPVVVERHLKAIRKHSPQAKVLFHTVDLHYLRMSREAELFEDDVKMKAADEMKQRELAAIHAVDASSVVSTAELELLRQELPDERIHILPLIRDIRGTDKSFKDRRDVVFVGGYQHTPNVDAVQYFVNDVMPILRRRLPGVCFYVVGSKVPAEIQALASEDVIITGFVEDLSPLLDRMRVNVAPLRYGAGIKGKTGAAMAVGLPTVATSLAAEGMSLTNGENILVADGAEALADAVAQLYGDEALWEKLSTNGLEFADNAWGAEAAWRILAGILRELGLESVRNSRQLTLYTPHLSSPPAIQNRKSNSVVNDDYQTKLQQELAIYEKQLNVHDLPDIFHYWSNKYLAPIFLEAGFKSIAEFFSSNLLEAKNRTGSTVANFVSVGAGNCDSEVSVARNLVNAGFKDFILECLEINPVMLERGKEIARENGVLSNMRFVEADFNIWEARTKYDGAMANHSLHHVTNLEHLFDQIKNSLHTKGSFVISDMIGRNGHQRWPESLEIVNKFWKELPESYKFNVLLNRLENEYDNWDCSKEGFEGIRVQDILPLLVKNFHCEKFIGFGSAIDIFVDRCFGHHFNPLVQWDTDFIDRVHKEDERGLLNGQLTPTHMLAVFVKCQVDKPYYSRNLAPEACIRRAG